jgi:hypothetical protein
MDSNYDDDYLQYYVNRNNYISRIVEDNEKRKKEEKMKNEKIRKYYNFKDTRIKELEKEIETLKEVINTNKENYTNTRDENINKYKKLNNLKSMIYEYKY